VVNGRQGVMPGLFLQNSGRIQLAGRDPEFVGRYMADMVGLGDEINRQDNKTTRIGFSG
jgi:hypothetical protein